MLTRLPGVLLPRGGRQGEEEPFLLTPTKGKWCFCLVSTVRPGLQGLGLRPAIKAGHVYISSNTCWIYGQPQPSDRGRKYSSCSVSVS